MSGAPATSVDVSEKLNAVLPDNSYFPRLMSMAQRDAGTIKTRSMSTTLFMFNPPFYWRLTLFLFGISGKNLNRMFKVLRLRTRKSVREKILF
jgi:hypothetical protein